MLLCALLVNPVLASIGEMHELSHQDYTHAHAAAAHAPEAAADAHAGTDTADDSDSFLHVLMHASHCCIAHPAVVPAAALPALAPATSVPCPQAAALPRRHFVSTPFRPPIAA